MNAEELRFLEEAKERRVVVENLLRTEGWRIFESVLESAIHGAYSAMATEKEAFAAAKHMGAWHALQFIKSWPQREILAVTRRVEEVQEAAAEAMRR
jgi:hypothetical protein